MLILIERVRSLKRIDWIDQSVVSFAMVIKTHFFPPRGPIPNLLTLY